MKTYMLQFLIIHNGVLHKRGMFPVTAPTFDAACNDAAAQLRADGHIPADGAPVVMEIELRSLQFDVTPSIIVGRG